MSTQDKAIPSAGPSFEKLLAQEVVIDGAANVASPSIGATGAQAVAPDHSPRAPQMGTAASASQLPAPAIAVSTELRHEVEQLLYRQAELLDGKHWQAYIDCFSDDGVYWMPVLPSQTGWQSEPSIFAEDKLLMEIRKNRVSHPNAWSQAPMWETNHLVSHVTIEQASATEVKVRSRFAFMELRREQVRHFGGRYQHWLVRGADGALRIQLQRVDLFNSQAPYDYVLQVWV